MVAGSLMIVMGLVDASMDGSREKKRFRGQKDSVVVFFHHVKLKWGALIGQSKKDSLGILARIVGRDVRLHRG